MSTDAPPPAPPQSPLATPLPWDLVSTAYEELVVPKFEAYARDALRLAAAPPGSRLLDVACGPGTLALLAAGDAAQVDALDFSVDMVGRLKTRAARAGIGNIIAVVGDGQALPYEDGVFAAAFSMFGLIFFPDRAAGFRELCRVLRPGGRAVVSSWQPMEKVFAFNLLMTALGELMPGLGFGKGKAPLGDGDEFRAELGAAGFSATELHEVVHAHEFADVDAFWADTSRSMAPLVLLRSRIGEPGWLELEKQLLGRLRERAGGGPVTLEMRAWLGVGTR